MARYRGADGKIYNFKTGPGATKLPDPPGTNKSGAQSLGGKKNENAFTLDQAVGIVNALTGGAFGRSGLLGAQVFKYPLDGQANFPARMRFTIHQVDAYTVDTAKLKEYWDVPLIQRLWGNNVSENKTTETRDTSGEESTGGSPGVGTGDDGSDQDDGGVSAAVAAKEQQAKDDGKTEKAAANVGLKTQRVKGSPVIQLYLPQSLVFNDDISYNQVDLGPGGMTALAGLNAGGSLVNAVAKGVTEGLESIFNLAAGQIAGPAAQVAAARISQKIPSVGLRGAAATALQTGINPGTRAMFDRPNIRQFSFQFRFIATSFAEAAQIESIIQTFREEMYPETIDMLNGVPAGYKFPNLFQVDFQFLGSRARFPKMQLSYLKNCQVNYNSNNQSFHADGHPTEIDMTLTFQEYKALSKQDIQRGY